MNRNLFAAICAAVVVASTAGCGGYDGVIKHHETPAVIGVSADRGSGLVFVRFKGTSNPQVSNISGWFYCPPDPSVPRDVYFSNVEVQDVDSTYRTRILSFLPIFDLPDDWSGGTPMFDGPAFYFQVSIYDDRGDSTFRAFRIQNGVATPINPDPNRSRRE